jgi:spermidine synthase
VKPWDLLDKTRTPSGELLALSRRGDEFMIIADGKALMSSRMHASEEALAPLGCDHARALAKPCVLVAGLGMGFTLRATLDLLPRGAVVVVSELLPDLVEWNRGPLGPLAGHPLDDPRVVIEVGDVADTLRVCRARFDAVLLDVDNGPRAFTQPNNGRLYTKGGLGSAYAALRPGGMLAVWSAAEDSAFERRMRQAGFAVSTQSVRGRLRKGAPQHTIFLGRAPSA